MSSIMVQLSRVEAERDQLRQQVERLLGEARRMERAETRVGHPYSTRRRFYKLADQVRKELGGEASG